VNSSSVIEAPTKKKSRGPRTSKNRACIVCQRCHSLCESGRPCRRCIKKGIENLCVDPDSSKKRKSAKVEEIRNEIEGIRQTSIISNTKESFQRVSSIVDSPSTNSFLLGTPNYIMDLPEHFLMDIPSSPLQLVTSPSKSKSQVDWNHYIQGIIGPPSTPNFNSNSSSPLSQFIPIHAIPTHEFITDENILKNPHFRHIFDGKTEKNETISMYCREEYFPLMAEFISKRISQEEAVTFMRRMR